MAKTNICVLFGGVSSEHEVSLLTSRNIIDTLDKDKYNVYPVGITKDGRWLMFNGASEKITSGEWENEGEKAILSPDRSDHGLITGNGIIRIDIVYLGLHGQNGEDGTIQGLLEIAGIPYIGANVMSSALCMDKAMTKLVLKSLDIPQAKFIVVYKAMAADMEKIEKQVEQEFDYPVFVKPSNAGSSCGAHKVSDRSELADAVSDALIYDTKVMIEEYIDAEEVECGIIGNRDISAGSLSRIVMNSEFYDYDTKYTEGCTINEIPAGVTREQTDRITELAKKIYTALDVTGLGRVDFFIEKSSGRILFNELNTLPGFTAYSAFPSMWADKGVGMSELLDRIIAFGMSRDTKRIFK